MNFKGMRMIQIGIFSGNYFWQHFQGTNSGNPFNDTCQRTPSWNAFKEHFQGTLPCNGHFQGTLSRSTFREPLQETIAERSANLEGITVEKPPPLPPVHWMVLGLAVICGVIVLREGKQT